MRDGGTTIVIVEQSVNLALGVADRASFMEKGEIRFSGPAAELLDQPDLLRSVYLHARREGLRGTSIGGGHSWRDRSRAIAAAQHRDAGKPPALSIAGAPP